MKIGLISDTHGFLDERVFEHFKECDEIWHAGDIGSMELLEKLEAFKPLKAVFGNIDDFKIRSATVEHLIWNCEGVNVYMTHIGGKPGNYSKPALEKLNQNNPSLMICGHSHICLVKYDQTKNLLFMNPGAAGNHGFHKVKTLLRFDISNSKVENLEVIELGGKSK